jgi:tetraacyldisaccharide 4'-kinase
MDLAVLHKTLRSNFLGRILLWFLSLFYRTAIALRKYIYEMGFFKTNSVNARVVCIGNITTGGTGKTTAVMLAAKMLAQANMRVAIITRGYKRNADKNEVVVLSEKTTDSWDKAGDEAFMMFEALRDYGIPVVACPDRFKAAQTAVKRFKSQILLMDDGFQHFSLDRDMDIVLLDARDPFGGDALLPLGTLREPKSALSRAGLVLITHSNQVEPDAIAAIREEVAKYNSEVKVLESTHEPEYFFDLCTSEKIELKKLKGKATALSAIGDPESFEETLRKLGIKLTQIWRYPDHHPYTMDELANAKEYCANNPIITTYKDFTRFPENWREKLKDGIYVLSIHLNISGGEDEWDEWAEAIYPKLSQKISR